MSNFFLGQITMFSGNFAPRGFAFCNGQQLAIAQNQALFSLLGTTYGGNGTTNFALPNLQSSLPLHYGQGPGQPTYVLGQSGGEEFVTITTQSMAAHSHVLNASQGPATAVSVGSTVMPATANGSSNVIFYAVQATPALTLVGLDSHTASLVGGNGPHSNLMPSLCISFVIALTGIFPSRN
jgi:microcystin-dependent protein